MPPEDRSTDLPAKRAPDIQAELVAIQEILTVQFIRLIQIDQRQIGVEVERNPAFLRDVEALGGICRGQSGDPVRAKGRVKRKQDRQC